MLTEVTPRAKAVGAYLHIPFCSKKCYYCAFNTAPYESAAMQRFVAALIAEIDLAADVPWARAISIGSVFFGGGTPSLLEPHDLAGILESLRQRFLVSADAEVTVECNPESVTRSKLEAYRETGVSRVSLGVQALDDALLAHIGRLHGARDARGAFDAARDAGIGSVSIDVMYGLPGLDLPTWSRGVEEILEWNPDHLSAYGLSLDAGSLWGATGVAGLPPEDAVVDQYWTLAREAHARGYEHYEVSNYARSGFRSRHNLNYWRRGEYLAFGPGAAGFIGDVRWSNVKAVSRYCGEVEAARLPIEVSERLTDRQVLAEELILGLRTADGVTGEKLSARVGNDARLAARVATWREAGFLADDGTRVRLTEAGFLVSDALFVDLI